MSYQFDQLARQVAEDGVVTREELLALRQLGWGDGQIHRGEAEAIFAINAQLADPGPDWVDFFVEALGEFIVNGTEPRGHVDETEADWLIAALDQDGRLDSMAELELLVRVMERAQDVPERLKIYALDQIENAVLTGTGPTRCGGELAACHITPAECALVRRIIYSCAGHGPAAVSRQDAEMLFRLKDITLGQPNAPEWPELFVKGVANFLTGFVRHNAQLGHQRMRELEAFMNDSASNIGRFMGRMARSAPQVHNHFGKVFGRKGAPAAPCDFERMAQGEAITPDEQAWLDRQINANGEVDALDRALLDYLEAELAKG